MVIRLSFGYFMFNCIKEPKFLVVITGGKFAKTRKDKVKVIPITVIYSCRVFPLSFLA